jgi:putative ABC transport system ATP-binding protein
MHKNSLVTELAPSSVVLSTKNLSLNYGDIKIIDTLNFQLTSGENCAIVGPSGSGKTSLLSLLAGLERPSSGEVFLAGEPISQLSEKEVSLLRAKKVGFVFQNFQLLGSLTALENVHLALELSGKFDIKLAKEVLASVGLEQRFNHLPSMLSGGEQQRVAIARALIHKPCIVFADEPTGNLDSHTAEQVFRVLSERCKDLAASLVLVTHDQLRAQNFAKRYLLKAGRLLND